MSGHDFSHPNSFLCQGTTSVVPMRLPSFPSRAGFSPRGTSGGRAGLQARVKAEQFESGASAPTRGATSAPFSLVTQSLNIESDYVTLGLELAMDWSECELVEIVPGKVSGKPVIKGTRVLADQVVEEAELGSSIDEIAENYPSLTLEKVRQLLAYASSHIPQSR